MTLKELIAAKKESRDSYDRHDPYQINAYNALDAMIADLEQLVAENTTQRLVMRGDSFNDYPCESIEIGAGAIEYWRIYHNVEAKVVNLTTISITETTETIITPTE